MTPSPAPLDHGCPRGRVTDTVPSADGCRIGSRHTLAAHVNS
jgi:hypothetical protein